MGAAIIIHSVLNTTPQSLNGISIGGYVVRGWLLPTFELGRLEVCGLKTKTTISAVEREMQA